MHSLAIGISCGNPNQINLSESIMHNCRKLVEQIAAQRGKESQNSISLGIGFDSSIQDSLLFDVDVDCCHSIEDSVEKKGGELIPTELDPAFLVSQACRQFRQKDKPNLTICTLRKNELNCTTIGNSGFCLFRFDSEKKPEIITSQNGALMNIKEENQKIFQSIIKDGDLLITGSESLFAALSPKVMLTILEKILKESKNKKVSSKEIAERIAEKAKKSTKQGVLVRKNNSFVVIASWISHFF